MVSREAQLLLVLDATMGCCMRQLSQHELSVLRGIDRKPLRHSELGPNEKGAALRLWSGKFIRLRSFEIWEISAKGRMLLDAGGSIH